MTYYIEWANCPTNHNPHHTSAVDDLGAHLEISGGEVIFKTEARCAKGANKWHKIFKVYRDSETEREVHFLGANQADMPHISAHLRSEVRRTLPEVLK